MLPEKQQGGLGIGGPALLDQPLGEIRIAVEPHQGLVAAMDKTEQGGDRQGEGRHDHLLGADDQQGRLIRGGPVRVPDGAVARSRAPWARRCFPRP